MQEHSNPLNQARLQFIIDVFREGYTTASPLAKGNSMLDSSCILFYLGLNTREVKSGYTNRKMPIPSITLRFKDLLPSWCPLSPPERCPSHRGRRWRAAGPPQRPRPDIAALIYQTRARGRFCSWACLKSVSMFRPTMPLHPHTSWNGRRPEESRDEGVRGR